MFNANWIPLLVALNVSYCGGTNNSSQSTHSSGGWFFSCDDYNVMLRVEAEVVGYCSEDIECGQVLSGTGVGCSTDDHIANNASDTTYFFELWEEATAAGCFIDFETTGECDPYAEPICRSGHCAWE